MCVPFSYPKPKFIIFVCYCTLLLKLNSTLLQRHLNGHSSQHFPILRVHNGISNSRCLGNWRYLTKYAQSPCHISEFLWHRYKQASDTRFLHHWDPSLGRKLCPIDAHGTPLLALHFGLVPPIDLKPENIYILNNEYPSSVFRGRPVCRRE